MKLVQTKLTKIQSELKAPKGQWNKFGKYNYRSLEDIFEGLKPLLVTNNCSVTVSDDVMAVLDRIYIKATVTFMDNDSGETLSVTAFARESLTKKGMDDSQITGTASSYARKYAMNGMFAIDDTKDADTDSFQGHQGGQNGVGNANGQPTQNNGYNQPQMQQNQGYQQPQRIPNQQQYGNQQSGQRQPNNGGFNQPQQNNNYNQGN